MEKNSRQWKRRILALILTVCIFMGLSPRLSTAEAASLSTDWLVETRISELASLLGGTYFNVTHDSSCGLKSGGHGCANCMVSNVIKAPWFVDLFGNISPSQMFLSDGMSCMGFVEFASWYIFRANNADTVGMDVMVQNVTFDYDNVARYTRVGDYLRLGGSHSAILISYDQNGITVLDSNYSGPYNCMVQTHRISYSSYSTFTVNRCYSVTNGQWSGAGTSQITSGLWIITVPAQYRLVCYPSYTSLSASSYIPARSTPYQITCTQRALLPYGGIRYFFVSGDGKSLWLDYVAGMTVTEMPVQHTVLFDANGGKVSQTWKTVTNGSNYGPLPTPDRSGYTFDGWYTSQYGGIKVTATDVVNLTGDQRLYAHWTQNAALPKTYEVTFLPNGGTGTMTSRAEVALFSNVAQFDLPSCQFTAPAGKQFDHWEVNGKAYNVGSTLTVTSNITVKAVWKDKTSASPVLTFSCDFLHMQIKDGKATLNVTVYMDGVPIGTFPITVNLV